MPGLVDHGPSRRYNCHQSLLANIGETHILQAKHPEIVERLTKLLEKYIAAGRSMPGAPQKNDGRVDTWNKQRNEPKKAKAAKNNGPVAD